MTAPGVVKAGLVPADPAWGPAETFFPADIAVAEGASVTWLIAGRHTVSFAAPSDAVGLRLTVGDGSVVPNPKVLAAAGNPAAPAPGSDVLDAGVWAGREFQSSGLLLGGDQPLAYRLTFSESGTYRYQCLVHYDMVGRVFVR